MLRSGRALRVVMTLLAFGVALQGTMPWAMRLCAMHATGPASTRTATLQTEHTAAQTASTHASAAHTHDAAATHTHNASAPHATAEPIDAPADAPGHPCDCESDCCGLPALALSLAVTAPAAASHAIRARTPLNPAPPRAEAAPRLLPFANGPPPYVPG